MSQLESQTSAAMKEQQTEWQGTAQVADVGGPTSGLPPMRPEKPVNTIAQALGIPPEHLKQASDPLPPPVSTEPAPRETLPKDPHVAADRLVESLEEEGFVAPLEARAMQYLLDRRRQRKVLAESLGGLGIRLSSLPPTFIQEIQDRFSDTVTTLHQAEDFSFLCVAIRRRVQGQWGDQKIVNMILFCLAGRVLLDTYLESDA